MKTLVTGGARSGKSRHAEQLLGDRPAVYLAPGPLADPQRDPEWAARVEQHRLDRPAAWRTSETTDLVAVLADSGDSPILVDCLGVWITALIDGLDGWDRPESEWEPALREEISRTTDAVAAYPGDLVLVTNEVGMGLVPVHRSGRLFRDLLGRANQEIAAVCDRVRLVVCGRAIEL